MSNKRIEITPGRVLLIGPFKESEQTFLIQEVKELQMQQRKQERDKRIWQALCLLAPLLPVLYIGGCMGSMTAAHEYNVQHQRSYAR